MAKAKLINKERLTSVTREQVREVVRKTAHLNKLAKGKTTKNGAAQTTGKKE